jgi:hypothetical protein
VFADNIAVDCYRRYRCCCCCRRSTLRDDRAPEAYPGAPWNANLAAQLLQERQKGSTSAFWPYIAVRLL